MVTRSQGTPPWRDGRYRKNGGYNRPRRAVSHLFHIRPRIAAAIAARRPVVALESTVITHGLPAPENLETALELESAVREGGAEPATLGILDGQVIVGLTEDELRRLASCEDAVKVSRRDLAATLAAGEPGGTTVAATLWIAARAGIRLMATGGIGGVHRGGETSFDVSADLHELGRTRGVVVCAGAKAVLDLGRTLEVLETLGVPVLGFGTAELPAFYSTASGYPVSRRVDGEKDLARVLDAHWALDLDGAVLVANPPPAEHALPRAEVEAWIDTAHDEARAAGLGGAALTPFLLDRLAGLSAGRTVEVNRALLRANAALAGRTAAAWSELETRREKGATS